MNARALTFFLFTSVLLAGTAAAQSRKENVARCTGQDPDLKIEGCTALIQSGGETTGSLAKIFYNRGNGYLDKSQYDRAIQDYDQAIRLNPNFALAFYWRGISKQKKGDKAGGDADIAKAKQLDPKVGK